MLYITFGNNLCFHKLRYTCTTTPVSDVNNISTAAGHMHRQYTKTCILMEKATSGRMEV